MIHPHTEVRFISPEKGYGVVATRPIPKGTITWVLDPLDRILKKEEMEEFKPPWSEVLRTYAYRNSRGDYILCWDIAKYVNHSFRSNCFTTPYEFEIAVRDIEKGEELTDDYGYLNIESPFRAVSEGTRRKTVYPDDLLRYYKDWDQKVARAMPALLNVAQPLREYLNADLWKKATRVSKGEQEMDSLINCYYDAESR